MAFSPTVEKTKKKKQIYHNHNQY